MAYILRRKGKTKVSYRVQVRRRGFTTTFKYFPTRTEEKKWARAMENKLDRVFNFLTINDSKESLDPDSESKMESKRVFKHSASLWRHFSTPDIE